MLSGKITNVIFEEGEERGDSKEYYSKDGKFHIESSERPELLDGIIYVWGSRLVRDTSPVKCIYDTEEEAIQALAYINEFTIPSNTECLRGEMVEVKDFESEEWKRMIYLATIEQSISPYIVVWKHFELEFKNGDPFSTAGYRYMRKISQLVTVTYDGQEVEVTKEVAKDLGFNL